MSQRLSWVKRQAEQAHSDRRHLVSRGRGLGVGGGYSAPFPKDGKHNIVKFASIRFLQMLALVRELIVKILFLVSPIGKSLWFSFSGALRLVPRACCLQQATHIWAILRESFILNFVLRYFISWLTVVTLALDHAKWLHYTKFNMVCFPDILPWPVFPIMSRSTLLPEILLSIPQCCQPVS